MKTQITSYLGTLALAAALLSASTTAFAATPGGLSPAFHQDDTAVEEGERTAQGLEYGGAGLGVGAAIVEAAAGATEAGQATAGALNIGSAVLNEVAAPIVRIGTR